MRRLGLALAFLLVCVTSAAKPPPPKAPGPTLPKDTETRLRAVGMAEVESALADVRVVGKGAAGLSGLIADRLERGLPLRTTILAIETLGDLESEGAVTALTGYSRHRSPDVRAASVTALGKIRHPAGEKSVIRGLSDPEPKVRRAAALALGVMRAKGAVSTLFVALDHKIYEAASTLATLCSGAECDKLAARLGKLPFDVVSPALEELLFRPETPEEAKLRVVSLVEELGTSDAHHFLEAARKKWPPRESARVRQALERASGSTEGSPGGKP